MSTLLLTQDTWDLCVDALGNIAVATAPYSYAQDVASACKLFLGELWYNTSKGVPYLEEILGMLPTEDALRQYLIGVALSVDGVVKVDVIVNSFDSRTISGNIQFVDINGNTSNVGF